MPLSNIQIDVLRVLAAHRDPESYVAGSTPLNRDAARYSEDIDVFHDREARTSQAAAQDTALLQDQGYKLKWLRPGPGVYSVLAERTGETTKLPLSNSEWVTPLLARGSSDRPRDAG